MFNKRCGIFFVYLVQVLPGIYGIVRNYPANKDHRADVIRNVDLYRAHYGPYGYWNLRIDPEVQQWTEKQAGKVLEARKTITNDIPLGYNCIQIYSSKNIPDEWTFDDILRYFLYDLENDKDNRTIFITQNVSRIGVSFVSGDTTRTAAFVIVLVSEGRDAVKNFAITEFKKTNKIVNFQEEATAKTLLERQALPTSGRKFLTDELFFTPYYYPRYGLIFQKWACGTTVETVIEKLLALPYNKNLIETSNGEYAFVREYPGSETPGYILIVLRKLYTWSPVLFRIRKISEDDAPTNSLEISGTLNTKAENAVLEGDKYIKELEKQKNLVVIATNVAGSKSYGNVFSEMRSKNKEKFLTRLIIQVGFATSLTTDMCVLIYEIPVPEESDLLKAYFQLFVRSDLPDYSWTTRIANLMRLYISSGNPRNNCITIGHQRYIARSIIVEAVNANMASLSGMLALQKKYEDEVKMSTGNFVSFGTAIASISSTKYLVVLILENSISEGIQTKYDFYLIGDLFPPEMMKNLTSNNLRRDLTAEVLANERGDWILQKYSEWCKASDNDVKPAEDFIKEMTFDNLGLSDLKASGSKVYSDIYEMHVIPWNGLREKQHLRQAIRDYSDNHTITFTDDNSMRGFGTAYIRLTKPKIPVVKKSYAESISDDPKSNTVAENSVPATNSEGLSSQPNEPNKIDTPHISSVDETAEAENNKNVLAQLTEKHPPGYIILVRTKDTVLPSAKKRFEKSNDISMTIHNTNILQGKADVIASFKGKSEGNSISENYVPGAEIFIVDKIEDGTWEKILDTSFTKIKDKYNGQLTESLTRNFGIGIAEQINIPGKYVVVVVRESSMFQNDPNVWNEFLALRPRTIRDTEAIIQAMAYSKSKISEIENLKEINVDLEDTGTPVILAVVHAPTSETNSSNIAKIGFQKMWYTYPEIFMNSWIDGAGLGVIDTTKPGNGIENENEKIWFVTVVYNKNRSVVALLQKMLLNDPELSKNIKIHQIHCHSMAQKAADNATKAVTSSGLTDKDSGSNTIIGQMYDILEYTWTEVKNLPILFKNDKNSILVKLISGIGISVIPPSPDSAGIIKVAVNSSHFMTKGIQLLTDTRKIDVDSVMTMSTDNECQLEAFRTARFGTSPDTLSSNSNATGETFKRVRSIGTKIDTNDEMKPFEGKGIVTMTVKVNCADSKDVLSNAMAEFQTKYPLTFNTKILYGVGLSICEPVHMVQVSTSNVVAIENNTWTVSLTYWISNEEELKKLWDIYKVARQSNVYPFEGKELDPKLQRVAQGFAASFQNTTDFGPVIKSILDENLRQDLHSTCVKASDIEGVCRRIAETDKDSKTYLDKAGFGVVVEKSADGKTIVTGCSILQTVDSRTVTENESMKANIMSKRKLPDNLPFPIKQTELQYDSLAQYIAEKGFDESTESERLRENGSTLNFVIMKAEHDSSKGIVATIDDMKAKNEDLFGQFVYTSFWGVHFVASPSSQSLDMTSQNGFLVIVFQKVVDAISANILDIMNTELTTQLSMDATTYLEAKALAETQMKKITEKSAISEIAKKYVFHEVKCELTNRKNSQGKSDSDALLECVQNFVTTNKLENAKNNLKSVGICIRQYPNKRDWHLVLLYAKPEKKITANSPPSSPRAQVATSPRSGNGPAEPISPVLKKVQVAEKTPTEAVPDTVSTGTPPITPRKTQRPPKYTTEFNDKIKGFAEVQDYLRGTITITIQAFGKKLTIDETNSIASDILNKWEIDGITPESTQSGFQILFGTSVESKDKFDNCLKDVKAEYQKLSNVAISTLGVWYRYDSPSTKAMLLILFT